MCARTADTYRVTRSARENGTIRQLFLKFFAALLCCPVLDTRSSFPPLATSNLCARYIYRRSFVDPPRSRAVALYRSASAIDRCAALTITRSCCRKTPALERTLHVQARRAAASRAVGPRR
eukprot:IDg13147t1